MTIGQLCREMTAAEFYEWVEWMDSSPPGDGLVQIELAQITMMLQQFLSDGRSGRHIHEVAPWLESTEDRLKREALARKRKKQRDAAIFVAAARNVE